MQADFKAMAAKSASIIRLMEQKIVLNQDVSAQANKELQAIITLQGEAYSNADLRREVLMTEIHEISSKCLQLWQKQDKLLATMAKVNIGSKDLEQKEKRLSKINIDLQLLNGKIDCMIEEVSRLQK